MARALPVNPPLPALNSVPPMESFSQAIDGDLYGQRRVRPPEADGPQRDSVHCFKFLQLVVALICMRGSGTNLCGFLRGRVSDYPTLFYDFIFSVIICPNATLLGA